MIVLFLCEGIELLGGFEVVFVWILGVVGLVYSLNIIIEFSLGIPGN